MKLLLHESILQMKNNINGILHLATNDNFPKREKFDFLEKPQRCCSLNDFYVQKDFINSSNCLVIMDMGNEMFILKQIATDLAAKKYNIIYLSVYADYIRPSCAIVNHVDKFLNSFGYFRSELIMTCEKWGEAIYIRTN